MISKKVRRKLPKPPPPDDEKFVFNILTASRFDLDKEFVRKKIESTRIRTMANEMDLARIRDTLIQKSLVEKQLAFILIAMRQKILQIPNTYTRKLMHKESAIEVKTILEEMCYRILTEIKDMPNKVSDPNWLDTLDDEEAK